MMMVICLVRHLVELAVGVCFAVRVLNRDHQIALGFEWVLGKMGGDRLEGILAPKRCEVDEGFQVCDAKNQGTI